MMRKDLSRLVAMQSNCLKNPDVIRLVTKYLDTGVSLPVAIETLYQKVATLSRKIARFTARVEGFIKISFLQLINGNFISN